MSRIGRSIETEGIYGGEVGGRSWGQGQQMGFLYGMMKMFCELVVMAAELCEYTESY